MPAFIPSDLNTPEIVYSLTLARGNVVQLFVDVTNLEVGDVLKVKIACNITGDMRTSINSDVIRRPDDPLMVSYMFRLNAGNTIVMTLEQTAGTPKEIKWNAGADE